MKRPSICREILACCGILALTIVVAAPVRGQEAPAGPQKASAASEANKTEHDSFLTQKTIRSQNLAAAEDEDDTAVYRHSASVRAIGRMLHLGPESAARLFEYINFAILFGTIFFFLARYFPGLLRGRKESIQRQLTEARTATRQAEERMAAIEQRLSRLDDEIAAVRSRAEAETAADVVRMKAMIEQDRQRIVESAGQEIASASAAARRDLKRFAGELAIERAIARMAVTEEQDRLLISRFSEDLVGQSGRGGRN